MKKKSMIVAAFLMLLAGCSEEHLETKTVNKVYQFETSIGEVKNTRAMSKELWLEGDVMALYGLDMNAFNMMDAPAKWTFANSQNGHMTAMTCNNADPNVPSWDYGDPIVWYDGVKTSFIAIYPFAAKEYTLPRTPANASEVTVNYTVQGGYAAGADETDIAIASGKIKKQTDMLVALTKDLDNETLSILLKFKHTLSQIIFKVSNISMSAGTLVRVEDITLNEVSTTGEFSFSGNEDNDLPTLDQWENQADSKNFKINLSDNVKAIESGKTVDATNIDDKALILLPQILADETSLSITYSYSMDNGVQWSEKKTNTIFLNAVKDKWEPNKSYTYTIRIEPLGATTAKFSSSDKWREITSVIQ